MVELIDPFPSALSTEPKLKTSCARGVQRSTELRLCTAMSSASTAAAAASGAALNPRTTRYEFLGPPGAVGFVTALPLLVLFFAVCCDNTGYPSKSFLADPKGFLSSLWTRELADKFLDPLAVLVYFAFIGLLVVFYLVLSCDVVPGTKLRDGSVLKYRLNGKSTEIWSLHVHNAFNNLWKGFSTFCNLVIVSGLLANHFGPDIFLFVYDHWLGLVGTSIVFSYVISLYLYIRSFHPGALLSLGGNSGNPIYDVSGGAKSKLYIPLIRDIVRYGTRTQSSYWRLWH